MNLVSINQKLKIGHCFAEKFMRFHTVLSDNQSSSLWKAKDYVNFIVKDVARPDLPNQDNVDRRTTPRMPWHDISVSVDGPVARDVARHFIQRYRVVQIFQSDFFQTKHPVYANKMLFYSKPFGKK